MAKKELTETHMHLAEARRKLITPYILSDEEYIKELGNTPLVRLNKYEKEFNIQNKIFGKLICINYKRRFSLCQKQKDSAQNSKSSL